MVREGGLLISRIHQLAEEMTGLLYNGLKEEEINAFEGNLKRLLVNLHNYEEES